MDSPRRFLHRQPERARNALLDRTLRRRGVNSQRTAGKRLGIEIAENNRGIGHGGLSSAPSVAHGSGLGAGRAWPDAQRPGAVDAGDAATAGSDRVDVNQRYTDGETGDLALGANHRLAVNDERHVATRSAHVESDKIIDARATADGAGTHDPRRGARQKQAHRTLAGNSGGAFASA